MLPVMVAGRELSDFNAKMQSYPEISACSVETGVFQGVNRSSMHLLHNRRGVRYMDCKLISLETTMSARCISRSLKHCFSEQSRSLSTSETGFGIVRY